MEASEAAVALFIFPASISDGVCYIYNVPGQRWNAAPTLADTGGRGLEKHMALQSTLALILSPWLDLAEHVYDTGAATPRWLPLDTHPQSSCKFPHAYFGRTDCI